MVDRQRLTSVSRHSHQTLGSDAAGRLYDAGTVDEKAIRRAALTTLRRAVCERFPAGREPRGLLTWAATVRARAASVSQPPPPRQPCPRTSSTASVARGP